MVWAIVGLCIATVVSTITIIVALCWERHRRKVVFEKLQEQLKLQEIAHHKATIRAELNTKIASIKWPKAAR